MLSDLEPDQRALVDYMSNLSEQAYCAGWEDGLELELWSAVLNGPTRYGRLDLTHEHVARLRNLSEQCGGWIHFDEQRGETWVSHEEWQRMLA